MTKNTLHRFFKTCTVFLCLFSSKQLSAQTTVFFQGFENAALTCAENWGYSGGVRNSETARTGTFSGRVGRLSESNTMIFTAVNISGLTGVVLQLNHSVRTGTGPGMDTREGADIQVSLNGGAWVNVGQVGGFGDMGWGWAATGGASAPSSGCTIYQCTNPLTYNVPAGTTTIAIRTLSVNRNSSSCTNFNTDMNNGTASNYDRADEGFFIDDVRLTTTSTAIPGIWTGLVSTDWFNCNNWHNRIVPTALTNVTIDQTAVNDCVVGGSGSAVCNNISVSSNNGTNRTLTVQNTASLNCGGNMTVTKSAGSGNQKVSLLNSATFTCVNLTVTGSGSGNENAQFENESSTAVTCTFNGTVTLNNGAKFDLTNSPTYGIVHIKGDYINNGLETDYKQTNSVVYFDGTGNQNINVNGFTEVFANVIVNKSSGTLYLQDDINIENQLDMQNGPMNLNAKTCNILNGAATGIVRTAGYIISENTSNTSRITWQMGSNSGAHVFPFGTLAGTYIPFTFDPTSGTSGNVTLSTYGTGANNLPWPTTPTNVTNLWSAIGLTPDNRDATVDRFWQITVSGTPVATLTFEYAAAELPVSPYDVASQMQAQRYDGSTNIWQLGLPGQSTAGFSVTVPGVTTFSPWTLSNINAPLPVELVYFDAKPENETALITWETSSEINNSHFVVERAAEGGNFVAIGSVAGNGTTSQPHAYSLTDASPFTGISYYRLKQVDFNGNYSYSEIRIVSFDEVAVFSAHVNYQPSLLQYVITGATGATEISVFSGDGKLVSVTRTEDATGELPVPDASGMYFISFVNREGTESVRMVILPE